MRGDVDTIKERLDIVEVVSGYVKLEKAGASFKARCPFHNEKTPSFFVSPARRSFYCFGCGAKGDIFTFVEMAEGLDFRGALKLLAEKAGVEIEYRSTESREEKDKLLDILEAATMFFEKELAGYKPARRYLTTRGINDKTVKNWRIGYAPGQWRSLSDHLESLGYKKEVVLKAGLTRISEASAGKGPYDVFRDRIIFPLSDSNGRIIAFSGRALPAGRQDLSKETEPKYLNSPDTILFTKSEVLYGLDKAKDQIRKKDYAVLVEGQMDLVLSHEAGVTNCVAASGTAFTRAHLERLKNLSSRIIIAFDGDSAGERAAEKASRLATALGFEVKIADLPPGQDPAEVAKKEPEAWKNILRRSLPAVEFFFNKIKEEEKDPRKLGQQIEKRILPLIKLIESAIEQSHFISLLARRTGIKEEMLWEDLKKVKVADVVAESDSTAFSEKEKKVVTLSRREQIEERLAEIRFWREELLESAPEVVMLKKEEAELLDNLSSAILHDNLNRLSLELSRAESSKNGQAAASLTRQIQKIHSQIRALEEKSKIL